MISIFSTSTHIRCVASPLTRSPLHRSHLLHGAHQAARSSACPAKNETRLFHRIRATSEKGKAAGPSLESTSPRQHHQQQQQQQPQQQHVEGGEDSLAAKLAQLAAEVVASPLFYVVAGLLAVKLVASTGEQTSSILIFAAAPVTLLTALSKSSLGKEVADSLQAKLPELQAEAQRLREQQQQARKRSPWYGAGRPLLPAALGGAAPHLRGEVAGDYGFDPLGLARAPGSFDRLYEAELLHGRWAMLGAIGCLVPEVLSQAGVDVGEPVWWRVGAAKLEGGLTINWGGIEGFRIAGKQGVGVIAACQLVLMGGPEYARQVGIKSLEPVGVFLPGDQNYPGGGPFDPLQLSADADGFVDQAQKEVKHGRMAMIAMLAYAVQAVVTQRGPVQNLVDAWPR